MTPRVSAVVLAAGVSRRFEADAPKQLLDFDGEPLVRRCVRHATEAGFLEVVVVVGHRADRVRDALAGLGARVVENPAYPEGQSTSVIRGVRAVDPRATAAVFLPCDQPFVTAALLDRLIAVHERGRGRIVVPVFGERRGAPVLFHRDLFVELEGLTGDAGGRQLFPSHEADVVLVELDSAAALEDINTPDDYDRLTRRLG
jgi:molybdenum cofactor cytidylyltransferase